MTDKTIKIGMALGLTVAVYGLGVLTPNVYNALTVKPVSVETVETVQVETKTPNELVLELATANGFKPSQRIINAVVNAAETYEIDVLELTAIGIVETGLGKYAKTRKNNNGTHDRGVFQINTVNYPKCIEYNLDSPEGSALCAAKLLASIKTKRTDYLGVYHSKTPTKKAKYMRKIASVLDSAK